MGGQRLGGDAAMGTVTYATTLANMYKRSVGAMARFVSGINSFGMPQQ